MPARPGRVSGASQRAETPPTRSSKTSLGGYGFRRSRRVSLRKGPRMAFLVYTDAEQIWANLAFVVAGWTTVSRTGVGIGWEGLFRHAALPPLLVVARAATSPTLSFTASRAPLLQKKHSSPRPQEISANRMATSARYLPQRGRQASADLGGPWLPWTLPPKAPPNRGLSRPEPPPPVSRVRPALRRPHAGPAHRLRRRPRRRGRRQPRCPRRALADRPLPHREHPRGPPPGKRRPRLHHARHHLHASGGRRMEALFA